MPAYLLVAAARRAYASRTAPLRVHPAGRPPAATPTVPSMAASSTALRRAASVLLAALSGCGPAGPPDRDADELRIGILPVLSGVRAASTGTSMMNGARMAADEANAAGGVEVGGRRMRVVLVPEDTRDTEQGAASAARVLINERSVAALVGPGVSVQAIGVAAVAERSGIPMVTPSATNPLVTRGRRFSFRVSLMDSAQGVVLGRFAARELGARRLAILFDVADPYNRGLAETLRDAFTRQGGEVAAYETYTTDAAGDYRAPLRRIRDSGAEVLVLPNYTADARVQMRQAREVGFTGRFLGTDSWENAPGIEHEPAAEGAFYPRKWFPAALGERAADFAARYRARFGEAPAMSAAATFDAVGLILEAARSAGSPAPARLRDALAGVRNYPGVTGAISYRGSGDPSKVFVISRIAGGTTAVHWSLSPEALDRMLAGDSLPAEPGPP